MSILTVACVAIRQSLRVDVVFADQSLTKCTLVWRRIVIHIDDFICGTQKVLRLSKANETPAHVKRLRFGRKRHPIDPAMTAFAGDALIHVDAVVEINVIGQIVNTCPFNGPSGLPAVADRLKERCVFPNLRMTRHTYFGRRHAGK
jgi:hypothetical protein